MYYKPSLTLTLIDPATKTYRLISRTLYPAGETEGSSKTTFDGSKRVITVEVVDDPMFRTDHYVTSTQDFQRQSGENEVEEIMVKDGKEKATGTVIYRDSGSRAA